MPERPEAQEWVSLADAVRITNRHATTLKGWLLSSTPLDSRMQPVTLYYAGAEPARFYAGEVRQLAAKRGTGNAYAIRLDALRRVHEAHGGVFWRPDNAQAGQTTPPHVAEELQALRLKVRELEAQVTALQQQLHYYQSGGRSVLSGTLSSAASAAPVASSYPAGYLRSTEPRPSVSRGSGLARGKTGDGETVPIDELPELPEGYVSVHSVATPHGIGGHNSSFWRQHKRLQGAIQKGKWQHNDYLVKNALIMPEGVRIFGECCGTSKHWSFCEDKKCPACAGARWARDEKARRERGRGRSVDEERETESETIETLAGLSTGLHV